MKHTSSVCILVCLITQLLIVTLSVKADTYYATPSSSIPCPEEEDAPCFTLSEYANKPTNYFTPVTILILLPGSHTLNTYLQISNINTLKMASMDEASSTTEINCEDFQSLKLDSIESVILTELNFYECVDMTVTSVTFFTLSYCIFRSTNHSGIGLDLQLVPLELSYSGIILNCTFSTMIVPEMDHTRYDSVKKLGGALYLNHSDVIIRDCFFDGNTAMNGGAIGAVGSTRSVIDNVSFTNNKAMAIPLYSATKEITLVEGGALYAIDSNIEIRNSLFQNNTAVGDEYSNVMSQGGAIYFRHGNISLEDCSFIANQALTSGAVIIQDSSLFASITTFIGNTAVYYYGGAMEVINSNATITESVYHYNTASKWGGALYVLNGNVTINDADFRYNSAGEGSSALHLFGDGPGLAFVYVNNLSVIDNVDNSTSTIVFGSTTFVSSGIVDIVNNSCGPNCVAISATFSTILFSGKTTIASNNGHAYFGMCNTTFEGHTNIMSTIEGRGFQATISNIVFDGTINIMFNKAIDNQCGGAIYAIESLISMYGVTTIAYNEAFCGGGIYAYQSEVNLRGAVYIMGNIAEVNGGGIYAIDTKTRHYGQSLTIYNNTAKFGGGMYLELNSKLYIFKEMECNDSSCGDSQCSKTVPDTWLRVDFVDNSAVFGGALYIADQSICTTAPIDTGEKTIASECFLQCFATYVWRCGYINIRNIFFSNNSAQNSGDSIYGGILDRCSLSSGSEIFKKYLSSSESAILPYITNVTNIENDDIESQISSPPVRLCFCKPDHKPDCSYQLPKMNVTKGETVRVSLVAVDQVNNTVPNTKIYSGLSLEAGLSKGQIVQSTNGDGNCSDLKYNIISSHDHENLTLYADGPCKDIGISLRKVEIQFLPCPIGFNDSGTACECHPKLSRYIHTCSIDSESVLRKDNVWISAVLNDSVCESDCFLTYQHCPFDYCYPSTETVWINLNEDNGSDVQCAFNRSGTLCGSCQDDLSLSLGSSQCKSCSNEWVLLLISFAVAGVALVALLLVCNLTVAVGTINGLIFYANIIASNRSTFVPFTSPNILTIFVAWLNLDFGFEACFFHGLNGYTKTWLQFAFPLYIIFLVTFIIFLGERSRRFARLISSKNPVATLATLLLLSYTKLLRTVIAALQFAILKYPDGSHRFLWLIDASTGYFDAKHIPLFVTAIIVLIVGLLYTFVLLFWQCLQSCPTYRFVTKWTRNLKLYSFMDAYHAPYNAKHRYWTGLLLFVRIVLYLVSAIGNVHGDPNVNLLCIICIVGVLQLMSIVVYKKWLLNCLESSFLFNCTVLSAATLYVRHSNGNQAAVATTSTIIAFVTFVGILIYHMYKYVLPKKLKRQACGVQVYRRNQRVVGAVGFQHLLDPEAENRAEKDDKMAGGPQNVGSNRRICTRTEIEGRPPAAMKRQEEIEDFLRATEPLMKEE